MRAVLLLIIIKL